MTNANEWHTNTGTVPDGVGSDTVIEVEYRSGLVATWQPMDWPCANDPDLWSISDFEADIIRWRFV